MTRKRFFGFLIFFILLIILIPIGNILMTRFREDDATVVVPYGYTDDASHLNQTKIAKEIDVPKAPQAIVQQLSQLIKDAKKNQQKISVAGAKHSMGGHTMYPDGIVLNMLPYNHMNLDKERNILIVGSGALWSDIIEYLDKSDKSVAIMQALSSFSVGGSMSVNGHGWQKNSPPVSDSVISFTLMNQNGDVITCSRDTNKALFELVIGGYGLFGIILDVKLRVVDNLALQYKHFVMPTNQYLDYYQKYVTDNPKANLVYGRLSISANDFLNEATLNIFEKTTDEIPTFEPSKSNEIQRLILRASVNSEYGKTQRWTLEKANMALQENNIFSRNQLLNNDVKYIANKHNDSTDILHEYFIPRRNFNQYIEDIKPVLQHTDIDLLNITMRAVNEDMDSFMPYANEDVLGFVYLFNQKKTKEHEIQMQQLAQQLVDIAQKNQGTYYLPYRLHISREKIREIYPNADEFFRLKKHYDPEEIFNNKFYLHYK